MITMPIGFEFLKRLHTMPSWSEIAYVFELQLIPPNVVIDYAMAKILVADEPNDDELVIASASVQDSLVDRVRKLAAEEGASDESALRLRWVNILLAWIYDHRDEMDSPLSAVEEVYTDYNRPEALAPFIKSATDDTPDQQVLASIGEYVSHYFDVSN